MGIVILDVSGNRVWLYFIIDEFVVRVVENMVFLFHDDMHCTQDIERIVDPPLNVFEVDLV
jgi:hypothetical protein